MSDSHLCEASRWNKIWPCHIGGSIKCYQVFSLHTPIHVDWAVTLHYNFTLYFVSPIGRPWRQRIFRRKTLINALAQLVYFLMHSKRNTGIDAKRMHLAACILGRAQWCHGHSWNGIKCSGFERSCWGGGGVLRERKVYNYWFNFGDILLGSSYEVLCLIVWFQGSEIVNFYFLLSRHLGLQQMTESQQTLAAV